MELNLSRPEVLTITSALNHMLHYLADGSQIIPVDPERFRTMRRNIQNILHKIMLLEKDMWDKYKETHGEFTE